MLGLLVVGILSGMGPWAHGDAVMPGTGAGNFDPPGLPVRAQEPAGPPAFVPMHLFHGADAGWPGGPLPAVNPDVPLFPQLAPDGGAGSQTRNSTVMTLDMDRLARYGGAPSAAEALYNWAAEPRSRQAGTMSPLNGNSLKPDSPAADEQKASIVPEPATLALFGIALAGWASSKLRHRLVRL